MEEFKVDAPVVTETWLKDNKEDDQWTKSCEFNTNGYQMQTINRINRIGGGVALITKNEASITSLDTNNYTSSEYKTWNIQIKSKLNYTVTGFYHSPSNCQANDNNSTFLDKFTDLVSLLSSNSKNIIILEDINMHIDNIDDQETQTLLDSLAAFNLTQYVRIPTHNKGHNLDIIITTTEDDPSQPTNTIAGPYISDHRLFILETSETKLETKIKRHKFNKINENTIHEFCENFNNDRILQATIL